MATELGQAYVQIMPSAKGISGSIQKTLDPESMKAGKSAGSNIAAGIAKSMGSAGKTLTKAITLPAMGAVTAIGGIVGALGFKRLSGIDNATAKLKGMGYTSEDVERISSQALTAIETGMMELSEATDVAAGALAAGVKEGAELERYIGLVDAAAVGANREVGDMAQIFNRVQGSGKLMTQELNMIEQGMPGFSAAMAKHLGVSQEELRKMVTEGKVSSDQFLDVMDDFAGGMAEAYAGTWSGMVSYTKSYIGKIGSNILGGVFEQSKDSIKEFNDFLTSEEVVAWATRTGEKVGEVFGNIVESVKNVIEWWTGLDDSTKSLIGKFALFAVAIGPLLSIGSKLITGAIKVNELFNVIKPALIALKGAIAGISAPILVTIGVIAGLIAIFVALYKSNEDFRNLVDSAWETIKETIGSAIQAISDFVMDIFGGLVNWWNENNELIKETIQEVWNKVQSVIMAVLDFIVPLIKTAWEGIKNTTEAVWGLIKTVIEAVLELVIGIITATMKLITGDWKGAWLIIKNTVSNSLSFIKDIISNLLNVAFTIVKSVLNNIRASFSSIFTGLKGIVTGAFGAVRTAIRNGLNTAWTTVTGFFSKFKDAGRNIVNSIADGIKGAISKVTDAISNVTKKIRDFLPFSPAKDGPLKDLDKLNFGGTISLGIDDGADEVQKAMEDMLTMPKLKSQSKTVDSEYHRGREIVQEITINSPKELTPSETARQIKNASRNLAMEW